MQYIDSDCVDCGFPCMQDACPYYRVTRYKCDECGEEDVTLYEFDGVELCIDCVKKQLVVVEGSEVYDY